jgi:hypothetical protein
MSAVKLSERQQAALLALADLQGPAYGDALVAQMCSNGRETSLAAAHQAANALDGKGLAWKLYSRHREPIRYEITAKGRELAARIRGAE